MCKGEEETVERMGRPLRCEMVSGTPISMGLPEVSLTLVSGSRRASDRIRSGSAVLLGWRGGHGGGAKRQPKTRTLRGRGNRHVRRNDATKVASSRRGRARKPASAPVLTPSGSAFSNAESYRSVTGGRRGRSGGGDRGSPAQGSGAGGGKCPPGSRVRAGEGESGGGRHRQGGHQIREP
ncbi:unnamed protein product [Arctia plantaginis]|uniref:Uncharacterized protein n=1 Tax=Arctia plantaginis TaxID=874455 RepID=A0A8S0ZRQ1_ARCPL|nr:unnamed protein product [Arctia plantaginis]